MSRRWPEAVRRRKVGEALRLYARLLVEHERVRRLRTGTSPGLILSRVTVAHLLMRRFVLQYG